MLSVGIFDSPDCFGYFKVIIFGKSGGDDVMELCVILNVWWDFVATNVGGR